MPPLPADSIHARACKLKCEKILTRPILLAVSFVLELADMGIRFGIITASAQIASVIPGVGLGIMLLAFVFTIAELILKKDEVKPPIQLIIEEHLAKTVAALPEPPSDWEQANLALA